MFNWIRKIFRKKPAQALRDIDHDQVLPKKWSKPELRRLPDVPRELLANRVHAPQARPYGSQQPPFPSPRFGGTVPAPPPAPSNDGLLTGLVIAHLLNPPQPAPAPATSASQDFTPDYALITAVPACKPWADSPTPPPAPADDGYAIRETRMFDDAPPPPPPASESWSSSSSDSYSSSSSSDSYSSSDSSSSYGD